MRKGGPSDVENDDEGVQGGDRGGTRSRKKGWWACACSVHQQRRFVKRGLVKRRVAAGGVRGD